MQIGNPIVHLKREDATGKHHIHVITWFDETKFKANGHDALSTTASGGVFTVTLYVTEDSGVPNMHLLTPVVHTLTLDGITLNGTNPFVEVEVVNLHDSSTVNKNKTHKDGADSSAMPDPKTGGAGNNP